MHYHFLIQISLVSICRLNRPWTTNPAIIHWLPVELLQVVFSLVTNDGPDYSSIFSFGTTTMSAHFASPPLLFTRVCHHWRDVAHSMPEIWSRIKVELPGRLVKPLTPFLPSLLQFWLACSGHLPLTIRMEHILSLNPRLSHDGNSRLLEILSDETRHWKTVFGYPIFTLRDKLNMPQLRTLDQLLDLSNLTKFNAPNLCCVRMMYSPSTHTQFTPNISVVCRRYG
jgi:hypothetical protein